MRRMKCPSLAPGGSGTAPQKPKLTYTWPGRIGYSGHVISQQPVEVKLLNGVLNAKGIEVIDSGNLIRFDGGVVMDMTLGGAGPGEVP